MAEAGGTTDPVVALPPWVARWRLDVRAYHRMGAAGILREADRVELIEGELLGKAAVGGPHTGVVIGLSRLLVHAAGQRGVVSPRSPVRLGDYSEPEPDLALLRPRADRYLGRVPPLAADVLLLIEVADSTLRYDRLVKLPLYARHGVPEVWIVDLAGGVVEEHRAPAEGAYGVVERAGREAVLAVPGLAGASLAVVDFLPPPG
jgi:Uma2 family endonuclease